MFEPLFDNLHICKWAKKAKKHKIHAKTNIVTGKV